MENNLCERCPVCGKKAFLSHDIVDGFDMGYGVGCPAYCHYDGVHGTTFDTCDDDCFERLGFFKKDDAIDWWVKRVKRYKDEHPEVGSENGRGGRR